MVRVSGPLVNVTTSASSVRDVQVHTKKVRAWGDGLMTPDPSQATLSNGEVEFEAAPGPVVMVLFMAEAGAETVSLVVGEGATQSLADAYRDGQMANDRDAGELAGILEQIRESVGASAEARAGAEAAAVDAAGSAASAGRDADRAEEAESGAVEARGGSEAGQELSEDAAAVAVAAAVGVQAELDKKAPATHSHPELQKMWTKHGGTVQQGLTSLDNAPEGMSFVNHREAAQSLGLPDYLHGACVVDTVAIGSSITIQRAWSYTQYTGREAIRYRSGSNWYPWSRTDAGAVRGEIDTLRSDVTGLQIDISNIGGTGTKVVPLAFNAPGGNSTRPIGEGGVRIIRSWAHMPTRVRVHISNRQPANGGAGDPITISAQLASSTEDGVLSKQVGLGSITITGEQEWVSEWLESPASDGEWLAVNAGWVNQTGNLYTMQGGGWVKTNRTGWADSTIDGWTWSQTTPFYIWIEAEVPARAPVIMVNGDSISIGTATTNPVTDSWVAIHCRQQGALPVLMSQHGSGMGWWSPTSSRWDDMYPGIEVPADAIIMALGQNDTPDDTLAGLQTMYSGVAEVYASRWPGVPVYTATVTPSNKPPEDEKLRRDFNTWLASQPHGERGSLDVAAPIATPDDEDIRPEYAADHVHPNTSGQEAMAGVLAAHPVTPFTLPESTLKRLAAL